MRQCLSFEQVSFSFAQRSVLERASFSIAQGSCAALIGPNGGGKTTLLRIAAGLLTPQSGHVLRRGRSIAAMSRREIAHEVALVPQQLEVPFSFTVEQIVEQGRTPYLGLFSGFKTDDRKAVERAIELADIGPLRHRIYNELSGGERQRVKIALGLAQEPQMLLLDEPTQNLDFGRQMELMALIRMLHAEGIDVFAAVHDLGLISDTFSTVILISPHERLRAGSPEDILRPDVLERAFQCPPPNILHLEPGVHVRGGYA
jgi:iron complex transport system ATP-binding protein